MRPVFRFDGFIFASLIFGLILTIVPLPDALDAWRPAWLAMLVLYWTLDQPERFGLLGAWLVGIAMDTLTGTLLGQHALALMVIAFINLKLHLRIRVFPKGYPVAEINKIEIDPSRPFAHIEAAPAAELDKVRELLLIWSGDEQVQ